MQDETHYAGCESVILHPKIPRLGNCSAICEFQIGARRKTNGPETLNNIKLNIELGDFFEYAREGIGMAEGADDGRVSKIIIRSVSKGPNKKLCVCNRGSLLTMSP